MTSHAPSAQPTAIEGGKEGTDIGSVCVLTPLISASQELAEVDKVPLVIRDAIGGQPFFYTRVIEVIVEFREIRRRIQTALPAARRFPSSQSDSRLRVEVVRSRFAFLLSFTPAGHFRKLASGV